MPKRKRDSDNDDGYEEIYRKVKKLKEKLKKCRKPSPSESSDESVDSRNYRREYRRYYDDYGYSPQYDQYFEDGEEGIPLIEIEDNTDNTNPQPPVGTNQSSSNDAEGRDGTTANADVPEEGESLDPEILKILGDDPSEQKIYGDNLHKDIATRWAHILTNGISKDSKVELLKTYLPAENCPYMKAPKLNLEIKAALDDLNTKKDVYGQSKQNQLSGCMAAVGKALNMILSWQETVPQAQELIKTLNDAGRLIGDCHHRESLSRRFAIINVINKQAREAVRNTKIDEYLFGSDLGDHLKSAKAITRTGSEMKAPYAQRSSYKPPSSAVQTVRGALNSRGMPRAGRGAPRANPAPRRPAAQAGPRDQPRDQPREPRHYSNGARYQNSAPPRQRARRR